MEQITEQPMTGERVELALRDLAEDNIEQLRDALTELHPAETANLLEGMPPEQRRRTWELVPEEARGEVLASVHDEVRATLIDAMAPADLVVAAEQLPEQDVVGVLEELPVDLTESILSALDKIVALAVLMPVVASMGGIAGSQTLTLTIRGLALDQIVHSNVRWLTGKEVAVGAINGVAWALVVALVSYLWFRSTGIAAVIAAAMVLNLLAAALSGIAVLLILHRMGLDPALSGAVVLTTVTDVVGFLSFLGLASLFLL